MKKAFALILILILGLSLVACTSEEACTHQWGDAYCTHYPVCTLCGAKSDKVQAHTWQAATMEAPRTCSVCGLTDGEPLSLAGTWEGVAQFFPIYFGVETESNKIIEAKMVLVLDAEGNMELTLEYDKENYDSCMADIYAAMIHSGFASQAEADAHYTAQFGMTVAEFAAQKALESAPDNYKEAYTFAYDLNGNQLLYGADAAKLDRNYRFILSEDELTLEDEITDMIYDLTKIS